ncbi:NUDIX hydrolase [Salinarimonas sp.]|uniref:NUDIX hydrolase n=1 Tax=Salinarimonas sp. TaxID=2766526 RepID=UPI0032D8EC07
MGGKAKKRGKGSVQYGALPYEIAADGEVRVLLVTSRETRRWVIPKGWPMKGKAPHEAAAQEAFEEAGVLGEAAPEPIGTYVYWKRRKRTFKLLTVRVFPLRVRALAETWPEAGERRRAWAPLARAADLVDEPGLVSLLDGFTPPTP